MQIKFRWLVKGKRPTASTRAVEALDKHQHEFKVLQVKYRNSVDCGQYTGWQDVPVVYSDDIESPKETSRTNKTHEDPRRKAEIATELALRDKEISRLNNLVEGRDVYGNWIKPEPLISDTKGN